MGHFRNRAISRVALGMIRASMVSTLFGAHVILFIFGHSWGTCNCSSMLSLDFHVLLE